MNFTYIDCLTDMVFLSEELKLKSVLGIDTEFRRTTKDNMKLALLQINDGEEIYLIDTIAIDYSEGCCDFLFSDDVVKIFHSFREDIEAIYSWTNKALRNVHDTQLAESFLGGNYSISYQDLVNNHLGFSISKSETRSNWIRRPLTVSQLDYAASDVEFLINIYEDQIFQLKNTPKAQWLDEEANFLIRESLSGEEKNIQQPSILTKNQESFMLEDFNKTVEAISEEKNINKTLLFSKKSQKDFLRLYFYKGFEEAKDSITSWRYLLLENQLDRILDFE